MADAGPPTEGATRAEPPPYRESAGPRVVPPSSPGLAAGWLLRVTAFAAVAAGIMGVVVAPGVRGNAGQRVVDLVDRGSATFSYFLLLTARRRGGLGRVRAGARARGRGRSQARARGLVGGGGRARARRRRAARSEPAAHGDRDAHHGRGRRRLRHRRRVRSRARSAHARDRRGAHHPGLRRPRAPGRLGARQDGERAGQRAPVLESAAASRRRAWCSRGARSW